MSASCPILCLSSSRLSSCPHHAQVIDFDTLMALEMFVNKDTGSQTDSLFNACNFC